MEAADFCELLVDYNLEISYFFVALRPSAGHDLLILEVSR